MRRDLERGLPLRALALYPAHNSPGKRDMSGAFRPAARKFAQLHSQPADCVVPVDCRGPQSERRAQVRDAIASGPWSTWDCVAFFCHGWRAGIQMGCTLAHTGWLASILWEHGTENLIVPLYACSTAQGGAGGDGGFADMLRDRLCELGAVHCRVDAHDRKGHTTRNPYVRRFEGRGEKAPGRGGEWIVDPGSPDWGRWREALRGDLQYQFPIMTAGHVRVTIAGIVRS